MDDTGLMGLEERLQCELLLSYRTSRAPSVPHLRTMKAKASPAVMASLAVVVAEAAGVALLVQAWVNKRVVPAQEDWQEENIAEVFVVIALHNHVTGCLPGGFARAHYLSQNDFRSVVIGSQSYYSYRIPCYLQYLLFISGCHCPLSVTSQEPVVLLSLSKERSVFTV